MVDKKLVATTVSSREIGMQRRINPVTTSSHDEKTNRNEEAKEEMTRIHISFKRKDSKKLFFTRDKKDNTKKKKGSAAAGNGSTMSQSDGKAEAVQSEGLNTWSTGGEGNGSSSKTSPQNRSDEPQKKTTFIVLQKKPQGR